VPSQSTSKWLIFSIEMPHAGMFGIPFRIAPRRFILWDGTKSGQGTFSPGRGRSWDQCSRNPASSPGDSYWDQGPEGETSQSGFNSVRWERCSFRRDS
jgi:hypothetical protein